LGKERFRIGQDPVVLRELKDENGDWVDRIYLLATLDDKPEHQARELHQVADEPVASPARATARR